VLLGKCGWAGTTIDRCHPDSIHVVSAPVPGSLPVYTLMRLSSVSLCIVSVNE